MSNAYVFDGEEGKEYLAVGHTSRGTIIYSISPGDEMEELLELHSRDLVELLNLSEESLNTPYLHSKTS